MICREVKANLPDLLLAPEMAPEEVRAHVSSCAECGKELKELEATMSMLDAWEAPEVSPYFDGRMAAMLREEKKAAPAGWLERLRARILFGDAMPMRPLAAGALALMLAVGGGLYVGLSNQPQTPAPPSSSQVIRDLQSLDENSQLFQQLNAMDQQDTGDNGAGSNSL